MVRNRPQGIAPYPRVNPMTEPAPKYIPNECVKCGSHLEPRRWSFPNADDDEWVCAATPDRCEGLYFDWTLEQVAELYRS